LPRTSGNRSPSSIRRSKISHSSGTPRAAIERMIPIALT
jgi:hypothetical protein